MTILSSTQMTRKEAIKEFPFNPKDILSARKSDQWEEKIK